MTILDFCESKRVKKRMVAIDKSCDEVIKERVGVLRINSYNK